MKPMDIVVIVLAIFAVVSVIIWRVWQIKHGKSGCEYCEARESCKERNAAEKTACQANCSGKCNACPSLATEKQENKNR